MEERDRDAEDRQGSLPPGRGDPEDLEPVDEAPGAVLFEMKPHPALILWAVIDLAGVGILGILALLRLSMAEARLPLALIWLFLPISSILGLLITAFMRLNLPVRAPPNRLTRWAFGIQLLALGSWVLLAWGANARF